MNLDSGQNRENAVEAVLGDGDQHVQDVLNRAEQELRRLIQERVELTRRIDTTKHTLAGLISLFGDSALKTHFSELIEHKRKNVSRQRGITQACREVLSIAQRPMSILEVRNELQRAMPALISRHKDPIATISTILSRLVDYGQATVSSNGRGRRAWLWTEDRDSRFIYLQDRNDSRPIA
ncbi:MAG: hypothetical protein WB729_06875 [Candidatus Sulfotelmatobacter sp.]